MMQGRHYLKASRAEESPGGGGAAGADGSKSRWAVTCVGEGQLEMGGVRGIGRSSGAPRMARGQECGEDECVLGD